MAQISQARPIRPRSTNGGITAPANAAKGPNVSNNVSTAPKTRGGLDNIYGKPPAAPPAASPTPNTPRPWDAAYESSVNTANTRYGNSVLGLQAKRGLLQQEYGLDPGFNDYKANPYSRAALLQQTYQRAQRASGNSLAAAGQLYSGASQNAETYNREHNAQERNALETVYRRALQGNDEEKTAAENQLHDEKNAALWKSIEAAASAELEPETAPGPAPPPPPALPKYLQGTPSKGKSGGKKIAVGSGRKA